MQLLAYLQSGLQVFSPVRVAIHLPFSQLDQGHGLEGMTSYVIPLHVILVVGVVKSGSSTIFGPVRVVRLARLPVGIS